MERHAILQHKPKEPSEQVKQTHAPTHEPYEKWCSLCVANKGRQDPLRRQAHEDVGHSVVSRMRDEDDKLTVLIVHDRDTNMCGGACPTQQKGGRSFQYLVTELSRFIVQTGHVEVSPKCDCEPSTTSLSEAVRKACAGLRITVHLEPTPTGNHQANGAAEAIWCMCFVQRPICLYNRSKMQRDAPSRSLDVCTQCIHGPLFTAAGYTIILLSTRRQLDMSVQQADFTPARLLFLERQSWATSRQT